MMDGATLVGGRRPWRHELFSRATMKIGVAAPQVNSLTIKTLKMGPAYILESLMSRQTCSLLFNRHACTSKSPLHLSRASPQLQIASPLLPSRKRRGRVLYIVAPLSNP